MHRIRVGVLVLTGLVAMPRTAFAGGDPTVERTRTLADLKCRFTLPNSDWRWLASDNPSVRFVAANSRGISIHLSATHVPGGKVDEAFVRDFEKEFFQPGAREKRGGEFATFLGLPCYAVRGRRNNSATTSMRVFAAHDYIYTLNVMGTSDPVEDDPACEEALRGFEFTSPPEVQRTGYAPGSDEETAYLIGTVIGAVCVLGSMGVMGALVLWLVLRASRNDDRPARKSSPKPSRPKSIFLEDED
jgi:hypothetical protein